MLLRFSGQAAHQCLKRWPNLARSRLVCSSATLRSDFVDTTARGQLSSDPHTPVRLRMEDSAPGNAPPICMQTFMRRAVQAHPKETIVAIKRDGEWIQWNREEYSDGSRRVARGFLACGLEKKKGVGIMGCNSPEWMMSLFGGIFAGGLSCGKW